MEKTKQKTKPYKRRKRKQRSKIKSDKYRKSNLHYFITNYKQQLLPKLNIKTSKINANARISLHNKLTIRILKSNDTKTGVLNTSLQKQQLKETLPERKLTLTIKDVQYTHFQTLNKIIKSITSFTINYTKGVRLSLSKKLIKRSFLIYRIAHNVMEGIPDFESVCGIVNDNPNNPKEKSERFPRGTSDRNRKPIIVILAESKENRTEQDNDWRYAIIYALKELFRELKSEYPSITFRKPVDDEDNVLVDRLTEFSLDEFSLDNKIEVWDCNEKTDLDKFIKATVPRLNVGLLQTFGILIIIVPNKISNYTKTELQKATEDAIDILLLNQENKNDALVYGILGAIGGFKQGLENYQMSLSKLMYEFSMFVRRNRDNETDVTQFPLKVVTYSILIMALWRDYHEKEKFGNDLYKFLTDLTERGILKSEAKSLDGNIVPDITYTENGVSTAIEIETFVGTLEPMKKFDETILKYKGNDYYKKIEVILRPISALIHLEEIEDRLKKHRAGILYDKEKQLEVKIIGLSDNKLNLVDFNDFKNKVETLSQGG